MEEKNKLNILFAGNGTICLEVFKAVQTNFNVVGVLTGVDKPLKRGKKLIPPEIKLLAEEAGIPVLQVEHLRTEERELVKKLKPDFLLSFSFGRIFGPRFLALFKKGTLNVHPSPLPEARGPAPVRAAILSEKSTWAISLQEIGLKMDEGKLFSTTYFKLKGDETVETLNNRIMNLAVEPTIKVLNEIEEGIAKAIEQKGEPSYTKLVLKEEGAIDFNQSALTVHSQIRANQPWPKAYTNFDGEKVFITKVAGNFQDYKTEPNKISIPGEIIDFQKNKGLGVMCQDGIIYLTGFQFPTKKEITHKDFHNQYKNLIGQIFKMEK